MSNHWLSCLRHTGCCLFVGMLCCADAFGDWPEFRGPTFDGRVGAINLPVHWSQETHIAWRTELPGEGWSSPVVVGDTVYLTAAIPQDRASDGERYDLSLLMLDVASGEITKQVSLFWEDIEAPSIHNKNSHASPTPVVHGDRIYLHFGHQGTACTSLNGDVIWRNDSLAYRPVHGNGGSPVVASDNLIFSRDGGNISEITALDCDSGELVWQRQRDVQQSKSFSFCTPLLISLNGSSQLIVPGSNVVQSVDPATGSELWRVTYDGYSVVPRPIFAGGLVYVCTGFDRPSLLAIDPSGRGDVTESHVRWRADSNIPKTPSLVSFAGKIAMVSDKGIASCLDAGTGELLWKERIGGNFSASPILAGNHLYLLSEAGVCTILDVKTSPKKVATNPLEERCLASPAVVGQDILIRTSAALYRIHDE